MNFHDYHGLAFCGPPIGVRCSIEKHTMIVCGLPPKENKKTGTIECESFDVSFLRLLNFTTYDGAFEPLNLFCICCRYPIVTMCTSCEQLFTGEAVKCNHGSFCSNACQGAYEDAVTLE